MLDWTPFPSVQDLQHIVEVLDDTSKRIFTEKDALTKELNADNPLVKSNGQDIITMIMRVA